MELDRILESLYIKYPDLRTETVRPVDTGRSNFVLIIGERLVFRFPRLKIDKDQMKVEQRILPLLKDAIKISIPEFIFSSDESDHLEYVGYPLIKGISLNKKILKSLKESQKEIIAEDIGAFLSSLHTFPVDLSNFPYRIDAIQDLYKETQAKVSPHLHSSENNKLQQLFEHYFSRVAPYKFNPCLIHGDLQYAHILFDQTKNRLSGVIDFGWMRLDDPAFDFAKLYVIYGKEFMKRILKYYAPVADESFYERIENFYIRIISLWRLIHIIAEKKQKAIEHHLMLFRKSAFHERKP